MASGSIGEPTIYPGHRGGALWLRPICYICFNFGLKKV